MSLKVGITESLAGRICDKELTPFLVNELSIKTNDVGHIVGHSPTYDGF